MNDTTRSVIRRKILFRRTFCYHVVNQTIRLQKERLSGLNLERGYTIPFFDRGDQGCHLITGEGGGMTKNLLMITLVGLFLGCSSSNTVGRKFDTTAINRIEIDKTTTLEVISMLGAPISEKKLDNGIVIYDYSYGDREYLGMESSVNSLQIQFFNGVVINKSQNLSH